MNHDPFWIETHHLYLDFTTLILKMRGWKGKWKWMAVMISSILLCEYYWFAKLICRSVLNVPHLWHELNVSLVILGSRLCLKLRKVGDCILLVGWIVWGKLGLRMEEVGAVIFNYWLLLAVWKKPLGWLLGSSLVEQVTEQRCLHFIRK